MQYLTEDERDGQALPLIHRTTRTPVRVGVIAGDT